MAYKYDVIPIVHEELPLLKYFNIPNQIIGDRWKMSNNSKCVQLKAGFYYNCSREFDSLGNITMDGYLQSWRYFEHAKETIKMIFKFRGNCESKVRKYLESISKEGYQRVCIHVRRKDRDNKHMIKVGYNVAEKDFFERARNFYVSKFSKVQFIVVTDYKMWCRRNLKDVDISPFNDVGDDLALMSMCDHAIITGGTFGWFGAWLSGGTVLYFKGYPRPGSWLDLQTNRNDYYPPYWIGIS
ncbi:galactoside 2-alpha-L-fucosyltransferase SEC1-like [Mercenaria mercenaria]|uniref:galactoside 2-alpha-L-fucosyltransferase SEC1-like n=1 Tax=Mercenaria mercenaria TaxID=6596 RepID=UPI00234F7733|nr:galactoside 2-alpha-L-fucosyltransferase SEC1-like [Mercenaria mercenaria]